MLVIKTMIQETIWGGKKLTPYSGTDNFKRDYPYISDNFFTLICDIFRILEF